MAFQHWSNSVEINYLLKILFIFRMKISSHFTVITLNLFKKQYFYFIFYSERYQIEQEWFRKEGLSPDFRKRRISLWEWLMCRCVDHIFRARSIVGFGDKTVNWKQSIQPGNVFPQLQTGGYYVVSRGKWWREILYR